MTPLTRLHTRLHALRARHAWGPARIAAAVALVVTPAVVDAPSAAPLQAQTALAPLLVGGFDHQRLLHAALGPGSPLPPWVSPAEHAAWAREIRPLQRALARYNDDPHLTAAVASAVLVETRRVGVDPATTIGILATENRRLNPRATSVVGAMGLMQVMPFHAGQFACDGRDLTQVRTNICHGLQIFRRALRQAKGNVRQALLRYNGCVRGTVTPDCHRYPDQVLTRVALARRDFARAQGSIVERQRF